jgi:hypothetical protein
MVPPVFDIQDAELARPPAKSVSLLPGKQRLTRSADAMKDLRFVAFERRAAFRM